MTAEIMFNPQKPSECRFIYTGPGEARGWIFTLIGSVGDDEIAAWGAPAKAGQEIGGWAWLGTPAQFWEHFRELPMAVVPPRPFVAALP